MKSHYTMQPLKKAHIHATLTFALKVLETLNDDVVLNVRQTQNAYNIGDTISRFKVSFRYERFI